VSARKAISRIPILTYHSIDDSRSPVSMRAAEFRRQMHALAAAGWRTIAMDAFVRGHREGHWPARTFVLTFDDGYRNVVEHALPAASEHGFQGTVFVAIDNVGGTMAGPSEPSWTPASPLLDWTGLRAVASAGWSVASHACTHRRLPSLSPGDVARELAVSKATIEDRVGARVTALAYPYGAVSPAVERLAAEHYDAAFGTRLDYATASSRRTHVERIDAYYLQGLPVGQLDSALARVYLAVRRTGRALVGAKGLGAGESG
jgi:peptidoglycan/xylan/chitin deacetylase (PgdA/CDA1 family)